MFKNIVRGEEYIGRLENFIYEKYGVRAQKLTPTRRGYYGETWKLESESSAYFVKLDYLPRHRNLLRGSLPVVKYLCESGIDFISNVVQTSDGALSADFDDAVLAVFEWIEGENIETDETKTPEYQLLCRLYACSKPRFDVPAAIFSDNAAVLFYENWEKLRRSPQSKDVRLALETFERHSAKLKHSAARLARFASVCGEDTSGFYLTHGDAGGNFYIGDDGRNYIVDWDEVMYAPLERDAWVMCCRDWARTLFNDTLKANGIDCRLRPERLAFYCYHMFFYYLNEFIDDLTRYETGERIKDYFENGWILERIAFADKIEEFSI